jgi:hypothetical protein
VLVTDWLASERSGTLDSEHTRTLYKRSWQGCLQTAVPSAKLHLAAFVASTSTAY